MRGILQRDHSLEDHGDVSAVLLVVFNSNKLLIVPHYLDDGSISIVVELQR